MVFKDKTVKHHFDSDSQSNSGFPALMPKILPAGVTSAYVTDSTLADR